ncbi:MAG: DUF4176 domain-containing protein [Clostridia bacterium]|nr:DUF4176 domain-containing protein [Clostridia bacterium]
MSEYLPVGSIINVNDTKLMIIGYELVDKDDKFVDGYTVVKYPMGYMKNESLFFVSVDAEFSVEWQGYSYDDGNEWLEANKRFSDSIKSLDYQDAKNHLEYIITAIKEHGDKNE